MNSSVKGWKIALQSSLISLVIHIIFIIGTIVTGYVKTKNFEPDMENGWGNVHMLQNEVAFGFTFSPLIFLVTFLGVALICGIIIVLYRKMVR